MISIGDYTIGLTDPWTNIPLLALLIVLTVAMYFMMILSRKRRLTRFGNIKTLERIHGFRRFYISPTVLIVKIIVVTLLFFVATDAIDIRLETQASDSDYVIMMDASASMALDDFSPSRIAASREISQDWLSSTPNGTAVGLIVFSDAVITEIPLTYDKDSLQEVVFDVRIDYSRAGTGIDEALLRSVEILRESQRNKTVLLLTSGFEDLNNETIARLNEFDVRVDSFGIGSNQTMNFLSRDEEVVDFEDFEDFFDSFDLNFESLEKLSQATGGEAYQVTSAQELRDVFSDSTLEVIEVPINTQLYVILLIALLSIAEFLLYSRFGGL